MERYTSEYASPLHSMPIRPKFLPQMQTDREDVRMRTITWAEVTEMYQTKPRSAHVRKTTLKKSMGSAVTINPTIARDALRILCVRDGLKLHEYACGDIAITGRCTRFDSTNNLK